MKAFSKILRKFFKEQTKNNTLVSVLKSRYTAFQQLLKENNNVLMLMADMEEKLSGEYLFDRQYIKSMIKQISEGVVRMIDYINIISDNKYTELYNIHNHIISEISKVFSFEYEITVSDYTVPIENLNKDMIKIAGGKIAHLGEIRNCLNLPVPDGFSISAFAFKRFMEHNNFTEKINQMLTEFRVENLEELNEVSRKIQEMVVNAEVPEDMKDSIKKAVESLQKKLKSKKGDPKVSVRSSAIHEDGSFSFAGQYVTFLNVPAVDIIQKYKEVISSLFMPRAIFYYKTKGFSENEMVMAVGVLEMIDAKAGGVIYSKDPNNAEKDTVLINAVWGLGKTVVDGTDNSHLFILSKNNASIIEKKISFQNIMSVCTPEGGIREIPVPEELRGKPCLTDEQIIKLFEYACILEDYYGEPQDIEWAVDMDDMIYILQSRKLQMSAPLLQSESFPRKVEGQNVLIDRGVIACKGIGYGKAFILKDEDELRHFPEGAVLVARHTSTKFVIVMNKASAILTDVGSATGHMASLSREYGVPTIVNTGLATKVISDGEDITVDALNCKVYKGIIKELLSLKIKKSPFKDIMLFRTLEQILKFIVPLNLVDPDLPEFRLENCKSLHDITRFIHEMAMAEIFKTGKGESIESLEDILAGIAYAESGEGGRLGEMTYALSAGIPIDAHLLDIDGCIAGKLKRIKPEHISSVPFSAFLKGMINMRWPEPRPVDAKGFFSMVANTAAMREEELHKMGGKSYAIVSNNYMNFSIRLGYHFSMVEAYAGENINDNYIKFFFKGGGAATDRRLRRVRLIREILKKMDFRMNIKEDVIDAILTKYSQPEIELRLEIMGKLTAYTKQLDMVMYNDAVTDMFIEDFVRDHMKILE